MEVVAEEILEMHMTHIGTLMVVGMRMRIRGCKACKACNDHNASKGNRGGKGLGAVRAVTPVGADGLGAVRPVTTIGAMDDVRDKGITD